MRSLSFAAVLFLALGGSGCLTPTTEGCKPSNCSGCCDAQGQCQTGDSTFACGFAGASCQTCISGPCLAGTCLSTSVGGGGGTTGGGGGSTGGGGGDDAGMTGGGGGSTGGGGGSVDDAGMTGGGGGATGGGGGVTGGGGGMTGGGGGMTGGGGGMTGGGGGMTGGGGGTTDAGSGACDSVSCASGCCVGPLCLPPSQQNEFACGLSGNACQACNSGSTCSGGQCVTTATCNAASCPNGCCAGNLCVAYGDQSSGLCGTAGASCSTCSSGLSCNSGACTATAGCDFFSCAGCCANGTCLAPSSQGNSSCGLNGVACSACQSGASCASGECVGGTTCNESNCNGCCNGNACITATNDTACGNQGSACVSCGPGRVCSAGTCINQAVPACLVITPNDFDFGAVRTSCRSPVTPFTVRNHCAASVTVTAAGLSGNGQFALSGAPAFPATLAAQQSISFSVTFNAAQVGPASTTVVVGAVQNSASVVYQTLLTASGNGTGENTDVFNIPLKTDAVFVIDDSCSMSSKQNSLGTNGNALFAYPIGANVDFNVGVTTADFTPDGGECIPGFGCFGPAGPRGRFLSSDAGAPLILEETTPNLLARFDSRVRVGTNGAGTEMLFAPSTASVTPPLVTGANANFLRTDSNLSFLVVTDAHDQTPNTVEANFEALMAVRGWRARNRVSWNIVGPTLATPTSGCDYDDPMAGTNTRSTQMVNLTGGYRSEICNILTPNVWRPEAQRVGRAVFGARATWFLTALPSPAAAQSITVKVAGVAVPEFTNATRNWSYDTTRNAVVFETNSLPAPGQSVSFNYGTACNP